MRPRVLLAARLGAACLVLVAVLVAYDMFTGEGYTTRPLAQFSTT
jgi:hypothetical protein